MELLVAQNAGFCFGVKKAMDEAIKASNERENVRTLGPIIHNEDAVMQLEKNGVKTLRDINEIQDGQTVIIRSHGIGKDELEKMNNMNIEIIDATCPYVKNIHNIVEKNYKNGYQIVIVGDAVHPEVTGINGWCEKKAIIVNEINDIDDDKFKNKKVCVVAQTTFNSNKWHQLVCEIVKRTKEALIINTICNATEIRQRETMEIAKNVDLMIVVGGKESSNTKKLFEISKQYCKEAIFIENAKELEVEKLRSFNKIGITAGASTPQFIIDEVVTIIKGFEDKRFEKNDIKKEEIKISDEIDYFADFVRLEVGDIITGKVIHVTDKEVYLDISYKSDGIMPADEASNIPINLREHFKEGDVIEVEVIRMNDGEGNVLLSRKELEKEEFFEKLKMYKDEKKPIEVEITKEVKGGYECKFGDLRCFMPISHSGVNEGEAQSILGKKVQANILEIKFEKGNANLILTRRAQVREEKHERARAAIKLIREGQVLNGRVKNIIESGAFVEVGDVDVFIPISEVSWKKISKIEDVLKLNQTIELLIIKVNIEELKVTGSIKRTQATPWENFVSKYSVDDIVEGRIVNMTDFGAFVELEEGVQGLVHISNMSHIRINKPQDVARIGQKVKVKIIGIDTENKKLSLSIKDAKN
ncbi:4-hydroxy-3-methylbut-2-enyl diphosphate reductase [Caloramator mitchellensis]|uniref:4-hydroxy-3-methylbut-2-enyl diphosphate reductase n=1 Tax=Caloramator mitchellensis TaxID=908809 RepID=A0A0R3JZC9_CALMK|nr:bifunctional 4-hydroxy-3-methylbut-2-enyl diphosphate reductase/30S ribosomal protein S1 [Caloramator mitchellensis]KRQ86622.1 4-hydroxy-3-methylbut-2-enyl diphosphate reductase [Caloramator mitchellensis]